MDTRREEDYINQQKPKKSGGIIILIIVLMIMFVICCLCVAATGGGLLILHNQNGSFFSNIFGDVADIVDLPINTPEDQDETPISTGDESAQTQPSLWANTLLVSTNSGVFAVNEQTYETKLVSEYPVDSPWDLSDGMSSDNKYFAYLTDLNESAETPMLVVLDVESQTTILYLDLGGTLIHAGAGDSVGDPAFEALRAIQSSGSIAWSPDGIRLAFIGALDGNSADVYLFDRVENSVTRLTDEAGQAFDLNWSPNGQFLQFLSATSFGTGAGAGMESLWAYDFQANQSYLLETLESGGETFLAWKDSSHFLISSWNAACESYNLRLVDVTLSNNEVIVEGCFSGIDYDSENKRGMYAVTEYNNEYCSCGEALEPGLMIFGEDIGYATEGAINTMKFEQVDAYTVTFVPQGSFFIIYGYEGGKLIYDDKLGSLEIPIEVGELNPQAAPTGDHWSWSSRFNTGLWVTTNRNMNPVEVSPFFSGVPLWSDDGQTIYFFENSQLFSASAPQFSTNTLITELTGVEILGLIN